MPEESFSNSIYYLDLTTLMASRSFKKPAVISRRETKILDINPDEEDVPSRYTITAYGADYPVDGLVKRLQSNDIVIPTFDPEVAVDDSHQGFQRQFVWTKPQCDRFIDFLLLGFRFCDLQPYQGLLR